MKSLVAGIVALGLTVWPITFAQWFWHIQRTHVHVKSFDVNKIVPLMVISSVVGCIVAICVTMCSDEEGSTLDAVGRTLCTLTFWIEGAIVIWIVLGFAHISGNFGVN